MPSEPHAAAPLAVLYATPECAPLVKTGGLGDVSAALPAALRAIGVDARVLLPGYPSVLAADPGARELAALDIFGHAVRLLDSRLPEGVPLIVVDCPALYGRDGGPYQSPGGHDWEDNALRFGVLSKVAALLGSDASPLDWRVDVVHANDWPTAIAPVYMHFDGGRRAGSLVTIHNLAFQGLHAREQVEAIALPQAATAVGRMEFFGRISFLKGGLLYADAINTVSPTYAREIQGPELGFALDDVLRARADRLFGVLNGIDTSVWDPASDPHLASRYDAERLDRKAPNKAALRERIGLESGDERPVLGIVSRLTHQKGIDVVASAIDDLVALGCQLAIVGTGEHDMESAVRAAVTRRPGRVGAFIGFDEGLAHLLEAGADVFLMPSRFEPCGMNQMYSQRYGTPPVANATGGLLDTVVDPGWGTTTEPATGYLMKSPTADQLTLAVQRALADWHRPDRWRALQRAGMSRDFGWSRSARHYVHIYEKVVSDTRF